MGGVEGPVAQIGSQLGKYEGPVEYVSREKRTGLNETENPFECPFRVVIRPVG